VGMTVQRAGIEVEKEGCPEEGEENRTAHSLKGGGQLPNNSPMEKMKSATKGEGTDSHPG